MQEEQTLMYYVRCRYCDSNWSLETIKNSSDESNKYVELPKQHWCAHDRLSFECPVCEFRGESCIFSEQDRI